METFMTRLDSVPTTSSNYGNKMSNPALMWKSVINPLTFTILCHTGPSPTAWRTPRRPPWALRSTTSTWLPSLATIPSFQDGASPTAMKSVQTCADCKPGTEHAQTKLPPERKQENEPWSLHKHSKRGHELGRGYMSLPSWRTSWTSSWGASRTRTTLSGERTR